MKKIAAVGLLIMIVAALMLGGCGKPAGGAGGGGDTYTSPDVTMGQTDFDKHNLTIASGTAVKFESPASAATHIICVGQNGSCDKSATGGPAEMSGGKSVEVDPGNSTTVTFATAGTYHIACTVHPQMNLTITVQ